MVVSEHGRNLWEILFGDLHKGIHLAVRKGGSITVDGGGGDNKGGLLHDINILKLFNSLISIIEILRNIILTKRTQEL